MSNFVVEQEVHSVETKGKKFGIRAGAYIIDMVALLAVNGAMGLVIGVGIGIVFLFIGREPSFVDKSNMFSNLILGFIRSVIYFTLFEWLYGATLGKVILGMRVVKVNGESCSFGAAFKRALLRFVDALVFGVIAYVTMESPLYQRVGDKSAKTVVVGKDAPIIQQPKRFWWFLLAAGLFLTAELLVTGYILSTMLE